MSTFATFPNKYVVFSHQIFLTIQLYLFKQELTPRHLEAVVDEPHHYAPFVGDVGRDGVQRARVDDHRLARAVVVGDLLGGELCTMCLQELL